MGEEGGALLQQRQRTHWEAKKGMTRGALSKSRFFSVVKRLKQVNSGYKSGGRGSERVKCADGSVNFHILKAKG